MADLREGIEVGQAIQPEHILRSINALSGRTVNDILIKGSLSVEGPTVLSGDVKTTENLLVKASISASRLIITEPNIKIGDVFTIKDNVVSIGNLVTKNSITIGENLIISGSVTTNGLPALQNADTFLSLDPKTGIIHQTTGSLREKITPVDTHFKFNENSLEDTCVYRGIISDISFYNTSLIDKIVFESRIDGSPTWISHKDIMALQYWINTNIMGDRFSGTIFWIKISVKYLPHTNGKSEIIFNYTPK